MDEAERQDKRTFASSNLCFTRAKSLSSELQLSTIRTLALGVEIPPGAYASAIANAARLALKSAISISSLEGIFRLHPSFYIYCSSLRVHTMTDKTTEWHRAMIETQRHRSESLRRGVRKRNQEGLFKIQNQEPMKDLHEDAVGSA